MKLRPYDRVRPAPEGYDPGLSNSIALSFIKRIKFGGSMGILSYSLKLQTTAS